MADTGLVFYCILCTIILVSLTTFLLRSYAHHSVPTHARVVVWISWNLCFSIVYILPLDLRPEVGNFAAMKPFYELLYWFCFFLTWILTPFQSAFIKSGGFSTKERLLDAIKLNVLFFVVVGIVLAISFLYLLLATGMSGSSLGAVLQALGNLWGLSFAIMTMGYGLVEIPRYFWFRSTYKTRLDFLYFKCWELSECRDEARDRVDELLYLWKKAKLKQKSPLFAEEFIAIDAVIPRAELDKIEGQNRIQLPDITFESIDNAIDSGTDFGRQHMVKLHMSFKLWLFQLERSEAMLRKTVCDVADFEGRMERRSNDDYHRIPSGPRRWRRQLEVEGFGLLCRAGAVLFAAVSVAIIWSEVMMLSDYMGLKTYLSVFALLHMDTNMNLSIGFGALLFLYLASCSLFALWRIHINKDYHMHPLQLTDSASMLTNAAFSMRFMFPLGLNFLMLNISKQERDSTEYPYLSLFHAMSNLPVIGDPVNVLVPMLLVLFVAATYFNLYAQILKKLRISRFEFSGASNEETRHFIKEGMAISIKFRKNNEGIDTDNEQLRRYLAKHSFSKSDDDERPVASLMEQSDQRQLVNSKMEFIDLEQDKQ